MECRIHVITYVDDPTSYLFALRRQSMKFNFQKVVVGFFPVTIVYSFGYPAMLASGVI